MKKIILHIVVLLLLPVLFSCDRRMVEVDKPGTSRGLPEGTPVTLVLPFGATELYEVEVSTKAASSAVDEARIHNLYVMIFNLDDCLDDGTVGGSPKKIYGRYFSYDHLKESLAALNSDDNECWYVDNVTLDQSVTQTKGAVKVSTITCSNAKLVVIANVENAITNMDGMDELDRLNAVEHYNELRGIQVCLEQDVVNRKDLFLMTGEMAVDTNDMRWGSMSGETPSYDNHYTVTLKPVDAKVKFRVRVNPTNISAVTPVYWQVCNTPDRCYLYSDYAGGAAPEGTNHFASQQFYFEGQEKVGDITYYTFSFYMLENRQTPNDTVTEYYQRELREKIDSGEPGYKGPAGPGNDAFSNHYIENGDWLFAPTFGTYVRFDMILTLTPAGIEAIGSEDPEGMTITQALTSDAIFTVHLGDFTSSASDDTDELNNYQTLRSNAYTYNITVNNTRSIFTEVKRDEEVQSGQEGFLLLTDAEIINADCHYEYHQMEFVYRPDMSQKKFSWYVKTPFGEGGPTIVERNGEFSYIANGLDYKWVMFGVNNQVPQDYTAEGDPEPDFAPWYSDAEEGYVRPYTKKRHKYPGFSHYHPEWTPGTPNASTHEHMVSDDGGTNWKSVPDLMDITQLIQYIFYQTNLEKNTGESDFIADNAEQEDDLKPVIRITAFIDEFYYDRDPLNPSAPLDPDLWRKFVNASPRELHILSDAQSSRDRKSDVILSSHSIIQQSIQTIYNVYAADLQSLWGTEHTDEMKEKTGGWEYWPTGNGAGKAGNFNTVTGKENGRLNSAYIWGFLQNDDGSGTDYTDEAHAGSKQWGTFLDYDVNNNTPELREAYHAMAYSCLTRNRDNNGNGAIDRDEVRWYLAACNQLIGMWVGNESLSIGARLYRPAAGQWRAHIFSSTDKRLSWSEEGGGATAYSLEKSAETWSSYAAATVGESVRCLRNIGTYNGEDITGTPYTVRPQRFFSITPEPNDHLTILDDPATRYVFSFERLNPKSLREYTESDLPYSDQWSINNCVYLEMETQSRNDEKQMYADNPSTSLNAFGENDVYPDYPYPYNKDLGEINQEIDKDGINHYCPPGYRFPNHTEMVLMSVYLPESFFLRDPENNKYSSSNQKATVLPGVITWIPTRTYFDRGKYGSNRDYADDTYAPGNEQKKVGFAYSMKDTDKKNKTAKYKGEGGNANNYAMQISRCVRDINRTGTIDGGILIKSELYPGDEVPLTFSFNSSGAAFISASLKFCFTDGEGTYHERDIPIQKTPAGLQFLAEQTYKMPTLESMGLDEVDAETWEELRQKTKFKITIRNAYTSETFEQPFTLGNPLDGSTFTVVGNNHLVPGGDKEMNFNISSQANTCALNTVTLKLKYKDSDNHDTYNTLTIPDDYTGSLTYVHPNEPIAIPGLEGLGDLLSLTSEDLPRDATLELTVTDRGGSSKTFPIDAELVSPLEGSISIDADEDKIYPGDQNTVNVSFTSYGSLLTSITAQLYHGESPVGDEIDIVNGQNFTLDIPSTPEYIGDTYTLKATATNAAGFTETVSTDALTLSNPLDGSFTLASNILYPSDNASADFSFSTASGVDLQSLVVRLSYIDQNSAPASVELLRITSSNPAAYSVNGQSLPIGTLGTLNLDGTTLYASPVSASVTVVLTDAAECTYTIPISDLTINSHITNADFKIQKGANIPVNIQLGVASGATITSATLQWRQHDGSSWTSWTGFTLDPADDDQNVNTTDLTDFTPFTATLASETTQRVEYRLAVSCSDGTSLTTPVGSVTVRDAGYEPNNSPFAFYEDNLHFDNGDFVEASIDITGKTSSTYNKDEMIGFGVGTTTAVFNTGVSNNASPHLTLHAFYRTDLGANNLRFGCWYNSTNDYKSKDVQFTVPKLVILLEKNGIYYNGTKASFGTEMTSNFNNIIDSNYLMIGAAQGNQSSIRSNAHYDYINIIRQPLWPTP